MLMVESSVPCNSRVLMCRSSCCVELTLRMVAVAERVQVELIDDLDGGPANQTVKFGFDGAHYVIDLSDQHAKALRAALATFVEHARVTNDRPEPVAPARELPAERPSKAVRAEKLSHTAEIRELLEKAKSKRPPSVEEAPPVEK